MRVLGALVDFELGEQMAAKAILGNHPFDRVHDKLFRIALANLSHAAIALAAFPAGVAHEKLLGFLLAGHEDLLGIDHHYEIARVEVGSKDRLVLAAEHISDLNSKPAQNSPIGINHMPLALV